MLAFGRVAPDLALRSRRVVFPEGVRPAAILIAEGRIVDVVGPEQVPAGCSVEDVGERVIMPGLVDSHVHVNEPGRTEWEGFPSATRAAAAGGVTTIVDMPLNSVPATTNVAALRDKMEAARGRLCVDCAFWGGVVPGNLKDLDGLVAAGVSGFKAFLVPSGVEEFPHVGEADLRTALRTLAARRVPLLVHAELEGPIAKAGGDPRRYQTFLDSRPPSWENEAIELLIRLSRETGGAIHVVHLSSAEAVPALRAAQREGLRITAETCPHYLLFAAEEVPVGRTEFKCSPPIRGSANRDQLWSALREGVISLVVSDHSPCAPEVKNLESGDFLQAWGGIASLQLRLPAVWTEARRRGGSLADLTRWLCLRPAVLAGLRGRKGRLAPGYDADIVVWDPEGTFEVRAERLHHRHKLTPYSGRTLQGVVEKTLLRGRVVYDGGSFPSTPRGEPLRRGELY
jgi:allantoinase